MTKRCFRSSFERELGETGSHIESEFLSAFCRVAFEHGYGWGKTARGSQTIAISPQYQIDKHRVDFLISFGFHGSWLNIIVECDGHDFHERTKEQARHDRRRDRDLAALGYRIARFTGSEINADARKCAAEIVEQIEEFQTSVLLEAVQAAEKAA